MVVDGDGCKLAALLDGHGRDQPERNDGGDGGGCRSGAEERPRKVPL